MRPTDVTIPPNGSVLPSSVLTGITASAADQDNPVFTGIIRGSVATGITATGSNAATAYPIQTQVIAFASVPVGTGAVLPVLDPYGVNYAGALITIHNNDPNSNSLTLYPSPGAAFGNGAAGAPVQVPAGATQVQCLTVYEWAVLSQAGGSVTVGPSQILGNPGTATAAATGIAVGSRLSLSNQGTLQVQSIAGLAADAAIVGGSPINSGEFLALVSETLSLFNSGTVQAVNGQVSFGQGMQPNFNINGAVPWVGGTSYNCSNPSQTAISGIQRYTGTIAATTQLYGGNPLNQLLIEDSIQAYLAGGVSGYNVQHNVTGWPAAGARTADQHTMGVTTTMNGAGATFTGSISGQTLTVSAMTGAVFVGTLETSGVLVVTSVNSGTIEPGTYLTATGLPGPGANNAPVMITAPINGATGGVGSYAVNQQPAAQVTGTFTAAGYLGVGASVQRVITANLQASVSTSGIMTVTQVYGGTIIPGGYISGGSNLAAACSVVSQLSGTTGNIGTYLVSPAPTTAQTSTNVIECPVIPGTQLIGALTGAGGTGTYLLSQGQTVASQSMTFSLAAGQYAGSGSYCTLSGNDNAYSGNPQTSLFGCNPNVACGPFATFLSEVKGGEVDISTPVFFQPAGSPNPAPITVVAWHIGEAKYSNGQSEDACFMMTGLGDQGGVFTNVGILFNSPIRGRALGPNSTLMQAHAGAFVNTSTFACGVDFLNSGKVAFTGNAWQSPGASIGPNGDTTVNSQHIPGRTATIAAQCTITATDDRRTIFINAGTTAMVAYLPATALKGFWVDVIDDTETASPANPLTMINLANSGTVALIESPGGHGRFYYNGSAWRYSS